MFNGQVLFRNFVLGGFQVRIFKGHDKGFIRGERYGHIRVYLLLFFGFYT